ncbi:hypothetical protein AAG570_005512 [Ranatra chinensis]|uniref:Uncharacterized protein n=1 Tax=Ranatra chinensis TaxID=642074 RepID=A0ABD0XXM7_9HEMI
MSEGLQDIQSRFVLVEHVPQSLRQKTASKRRNMFRKNKTQETTENASDFVNLCRGRSLHLPPRRDSSGLGREYGAEIHRQFVKTNEPEEMSRQHVHEWARSFKEARTCSERKVMASVFWNKQEVLSVDFMVKGTTVNAETYC